MSKSAFIDRIEGSQAVLLIDEKEVVVPRSQLPQGAREGLWLTPDLQAIDHELTRKMAREIAERRDRLMADDDGGDFSL